jgi:hypothetical protein
MWWWLGWVWEREGLGVSIGWERWQVNKDKTITYVYVCVIALRRVQTDGDGCAASRPARVTFTRA